MTTGTSNRRDLLRQAETLRGIVFFKTERGSRLHNFDLQRLAWFRATAWSIPDAQIGPGLLREVDDLGRHNWGRRIVFPISINLPSHQNRA